MLHTTELVTELMFPMASLQHFSQFVREIFQTVTLQKSRRKQLINDRFLVV